MKSQTILVVLLAIALLSTIGTVGQAVTFTWTGDTDLDWDTGTNWSGVAPTQADMGATNTVQFTGTTMPTSNVKDLGYNTGYAWTSKLELNSGGTLSMGVQSRNNGLCYNGASIQTMLTIGDGIGSVASVTLQFTEALLLNRHEQGSTLTTLVNRDGVLDVQGLLTMTYNDSRSGILDIIGGSVTADALNMMNFDKPGSFANTTRVKLRDSGSFTVDGVVDNTMYSWDDSIGTIRFLDKSSAYFTAKYRGDLADLAAVQSSLGTLFVSDTDWTLLAEDVDGVYFKVTAVPEPGCLALAVLGLCGLGFVRRRKRK